VRAGTNAIIKHLKFATKNCSAKKKSVRTTANENVNTVFLDVFELFFLLWRDMTVAKQRGGCR